MLAKKYRLPIQKFYKQPTQAVKKNGFFIVKIRQSNLSFSRFGVVLGTKVDKRAVKRNSMRRVLYDWIRLTGLHRLKGKDVMIVVSPSAGNLNKRDLISALQDVIS